VGAVPPLPLPGLEVNRSALRDRPARIGHQRPALPPRGGRLPRLPDVAPRRPRDQSGTDGRGWRADGRHRRPARPGRPSGSGSGLALRRGLSPAPAVGAQHRDDVANDGMRVFERRPTGEDESVGVLVDDENLALDATTFDHRILAFPTRRRPGRLQPLILRTLTPLDWFPRTRTAELVSMRAMCRPATSYSCTGAYCSPCRCRCSDGPRATGVRLLSPA